MRGRRETALPSGGGAREYVTRQLLTTAFMPLVVA
jgi:hypothetical protein